MKITKEQIMLNEVRLITLNEPFASLMAFHGKQETRNRDTKVRGLVCIHSAQKWYPDHVTFNISGVEQYGRIALAMGGIEVYTGHIIAIGRLVGTKKMGDHTSDITNMENLCYVEYNPKLWIWEFEDITSIEPILFKGKQGWTILSQDQKELINPL